MKKLAGVIGFIAGLLMVANATNAQTGSRINLSVIPGYQMPTGKLVKYYRSGFGGELRLIAAINNRQSLVRLSAVTNTAFYYFGGKVHGDYDRKGNYNLYYTDGFGLTSVHGGLRIDIGYTNDMPFGLYVSQDIGLTHLGGPTGGSRFGRTLNMGITQGRFDISCGFNAWTRSVGGQYYYFTFGCGYTF